MNIQGNYPSETAKLDILVDGGTLCVAGAYSWTDRARIPGLFKIYVKNLGLPIGPFYASLSLAHNAMRTALKCEPKARPWEQTRDWYSAKAQGWLFEWVARELGRPEDLVGAEWAKDDDDNDNNEPKPASTASATRAEQIAQGKHVCHWPTCAQVVPPRLWGCKPHWFRLPKTLRDRIWAAYVPGQENRKDPSADYLEVADEIDRYIRAEISAGRAK